MNILIYTHMYTHMYLCVGISRKQYKKPFIVFIPGALGSGTEEHKRREILTFHLQLLHILNSFNHSLNIFIKNKICLNFKTS